MRVTNRHKNLQKYYNFLWR